jgi:hypothetical protein
VSLSSGHVAQPRHAELDAERAAERWQRHSERDDKVHRAQRSVGKCLQHNHNALWSESGIGGVMFMLWKFPASPARKGWLHELKRWEVNKVKRREVHCFVKYEAFGRY